MNKLQADIQAIVEFATRFDLSPSELRTMALAARHRNDEATAQAMFAARTLMLADKDASKLRQARHFQGEREYGRTALGRAVES